MRRSALACQVLAGQFSVTTDSPNIRLGTSSDGKAKEDFFAPRFGMGLPEGCLWGSSYVSHWRHRGEVKELKMKVEPMIISLKSANRFTLFWIGYAPWVTQNTAPNSA